MPARRARYATLIRRFRLDRRVAKAKASLREKSARMRLQTAASARAPCPPLIFDAASLMRSVLPPPEPFSRRFARFFEQNPRSSAAAAAIRCSACR